MRISNPKDMGGNKLLHRVNVATGGVIEGEGTETSPLTANVDAIASNVFPDFSGNSGKVLRVNANETGTEWVAMQSGGSSTTPDISSLKVVRTISSEDEFESLAEEVKESVKDIAFLATPGTTNTGWSAQNGYVVPGHSYLLVPFHLEYSYEVQWKHFVVTSRHWKCTLKGGSCKVNGVLKTLSPGKGDEAYSTGTYGTSWDATRPSDTLILRTTIDTKPLYISDTEKIIVGTNGEVDSNGNLLLVGDHYEMMNGDWGYTGKSVMEIKCDYDIEYYTSGHWKHSTTVTVDIRDYFLFDLTLFYTSCATPTLTQEEALEIKPGQRYAWTLNTDSTLNAATVSAGLWASAQIDIAPGAHAVTAGNNLTIVDALTADAVNICEARWRNGSARLKVVDVIAEGGGGGTDAGTITVSSQTITGTAGTSLSYNLANYVTVSNGQTPTFTLASGQVLPTGLSLSSNGVISGTPEASSSATIRVKVSASNCPDVEMAVTFSIAASTPQGTITITNNPKISGVVGTAISPYNLSSCVTVSNGKTPSFSWNESYYHKPAWLTLTGAGVLSGTPSGIPEAGRVTVSADNCTSVNLDITWDIINAGTITVGNQTIDGTVGNAVSLNLSSSTTVSNGQTPTFTVKSGNTLPAGIELSLAGVLSGTPTATSSATVVVTITARGCPDKEVSITFNITEEQGGETPSDGWPTKIVVSDATATMADSSWSDKWNGTYTRTGDTTTALGETIPVWSNGKYYVMGYGTDMDSALSEVGIGFFTNKNSPDRRSAYFYRAKSATTWTSGEADGPGLTMTITEDYTSGGESSSSSSESSGETGGGVTYTMSRTSGTDSYVANAIGTYSLESGTDGSTDAVYVNENGWHISYSTSNGRWGVGPLAGDEKFICSTLEGTYTSWDYECNDVIVLKKDGEGGAITFPESFSVTACNGNGAAVGEYAKTEQTTTVGGTAYPVYSFTQPILETPFYIYVTAYRMGTSGVFWTLKAESFSATDDAYGTLGSVAVGSDGLPSSTVWTAASSEATVSWT